MTRNCLLSFDSVIHRHFLGVQNLFKAPHTSPLRVSSHTCYRYLSTSDANTQNELSNFLKTKISLSGPITVADYMKTVLTHPTSGYYMNKDVFGVSGDFITAPEISQIFGELLGVWCLNEWIQCGKPTKMQIVELGPGRGTLAYDILRVFQQFPQTKDVVSLNLVEVSNKMRELQYEKLVGSPLSECPSTEGKPSKSDLNNSPVCSHGLTKFNIPVNWYYQLEDIPPAFTCYIAHEFFDVLPVHKFQKTKHGWREVLVDINEDTASPNDFKFIISKAATPALVCFQVDRNDNRDHIEVSFESGAVIENISQRIAEHGGFGLIADYGHTGDKMDTLRGFFKHKVQSDVFVNPGYADLTADVDFRYLSKAASNYVTIVGPTTQANFLQNMGIGVRLKALLEKVKLELHKDLVSGCKMLVDPQQMGERYKFMALMQKTATNYIPAGFYGLGN